MFSKRILLALAGLVISCGGEQTGLTANQKAALIKGFEGLDSLEKETDLSWVLRWTPVDDNGLLYGVYKAPEGEPFNFNSPLVTTQLNIFNYAPENIYTEGNQCFVVRIVNGSIDQNENGFCTTNPPLKFAGLLEMERTSDGGYLLKWEALPISTVVYSIYQRNQNGNYNFDLPSWDAVSEDFQKTGVYPRGKKFCFVVRYSHPSLPSDTNLEEKCTEPEEALVFNGISKLASVDKTSVTISWENPQDLEIAGFNIYQGSDFKEKVGTVASDASSYVVTGLVPGRQYSFGVRAVDDFGRQDGNIVIRSIVMPSF